MCPSLIHFRGNGNAVYSTKYPGMVLSYSLRTELPASRRRNRLGAKPSALISPVNTAKRSNFTSDLGAIITSHDNRTLRQIGQQSCFVFRRSRVQISVPRASIVTGFLWLSSIPLDKWCNSTINYATTASIHNLSKHSLIIITIIWRHRVGATASVVT